jgi:uncharacterized protein YjbI with pentapeptide repeats
MQKKIVPIKVRTCKEKKVDILSTIVDKPWLWWTDFAVRRYFADFQIANRQNVDFQIANHQNADFQIANHQNADFQIVYCQNVDFQIALH